jgi:rubredoxin
MKEKRKCPKCGSDKLEPFNFPQVRASDTGELPRGKGLISYECQNCGYEFIEGELDKDK